MFWQIVNAKKKKECGTKYELIYKMSVKSNET